MAKKNEPRDRSLVLRVDNMTASEEQKLAQNIQKLKKKLTSEEARATLLSGKSKELPGRIRQAISFQDEKGGDDPG